MKLNHFRPLRFFIRTIAFISKHFFLLFLALFLVLLCFLGNQGIAFLSKLHVKPKDLFSLLGPPSENLDNTNGVTNFLILGIRGEGTDSPNLADTIIVLSYNYIEKSPSMISVPRDLWVPSLQAKINTAYYYGEEASSGAGIQMAEAAILEDLGLPIHYTAVINFSIFKETIDLLGGIDVNIDPGFTDPLFPISGKENAQPESSRYESVTFATGSAHMDGETALKFVRSRHATGDEGTDFARSRRQQQVISAIKSKILSPNLLLNQTKMNTLTEILDRNLKTNLNHDLYPTLARIALDAKDNPVKSVTLSDKPDNNGIKILYNPPTRFFKGEWVLMPKDNNWTALKKYLDNLLKGKQ